MFAKEARSEWRTRVAAASLGLFVAGSLALIGLAFARLSPRPDDRVEINTQIAAALLWLLVLFTAATGLGRAFVVEEERGTAIALRLHGRPTAIWTGKFLANTLLILLLAGVHRGRRGANVGPWRPVGRPFVSRAAAAIRGGGRFDPARDRLPRHAAIGLLGDVRRWNHPTRQLRRHRDHRGVAVVRAHLERLNAGFGIPPRWYTSGAMGLPARILILLGLALEFAYIFLRLPAGAGFPDPELARMITLHLPNAYIACLLAFGAGWYGIRYLRGRRLVDDSRSVVAAQLAALFSFLTTATGSVFAKAQWGSYWNWDPRQTCVAALLLVYSAYFLLRASVDDPDKRAAISGVYILFASVLTPSLGYVIPRFFIDQSLHPKMAQFDAAYRMGIYPTSIALLGLTVWVQRLAVRGERLRLRLESLEEAAT